MGVVDRAMTVTDMPGPVEDVIDDLWWWWRPKCSWRHVNLSSLWLIRSSYFADKRDGITTYLITTQRPYPTTSFKSSSLSTFQYNIIKHVQARHFLRCRICHYCFCSSRHPLFAVCSSFISINLRPCAAERSWLTSFWWLVFSTHVDMTAQLTTNNIILQGIVVPIYHICRGIGQTVG